MSRTKRNLRPGMILGHLKSHQHWDGTVRDGTPQHYATSCENHGGCRWCEGDRLHGTEKRKPIVEDEDDMTANKLEWMVIQVSRTGDDGSEWWPIMKEDLPTWLNNAKMMNVMRGGNKVCFDPKLGTLWYRAHIVKAP